MHELYSENLTQGQTTCLGLIVPKVFERKQLHKLSIAVLNKVVRCDYRRAISVELMYEV